MKKGFLKSAGVILSAAALTLGLTACGHSWVEDWSSDKDGHWHVCKDDDGATSEKQAHVDENSDGVCDVCKWEDTAHVHYATTLTNTDASGHYYARTCDHTGVADKKGFENHTAHVVTGLCTVCGYQVKPAKTFAEMVEFAAENANKIVSGEITDKSTENGGYVYEDAVKYEFGTNYTYVESANEYSSTFARWYTNEILDEDAQTVFAVRGILVDGQVSNLSQITWESHTVENLKGYEFSALNNRYYGVEGLLIGLYNLGAGKVEDENATGDTAVYLKTQDFSESTEDKNGVTQYTFGYGYYDKGQENFNQVEVEFNLTANYAVKTLNASVKTYNARVWNDQKYEYDTVFTVDEDGVVTLEANAQPYNICEFEVAQTEGERTKTTEYSQEKMYISSFELELDESAPDGASLSVNESDDNIDYNLAISAGANNGVALNLVDILPATANVGIDAVKIETSDYATINVYADADVIRVTGLAAGSAEFTVSTAKVTKKVSVTVALATPALTDVGINVYDVKVNGEDTTYSLNNSKSLSKNASNKDFSLEAGDKLVFAANIDFGCVQTNTVKVMNGSEDVTAKVLTSVQFEDMVMVGTMPKLVTVNAHIFTMPEGEGTYVITVSASDTVYKTITVTLKQQQPVDPNPGNPYVGVWRTSLSMGETIAITLSADGTGTAVLDYGFGSDTDSFNWVETANGIAVSNVSIVNGYGVFNTINEYEDVEDGTEFALNNGKLVICGFDFTKEGGSVAPVESPYVGTWTYDTINGEHVVLTINADGTGTFIESSYVDTFDWQEGMFGIVITITNGEGSMIEWFIGQCSPNGYEYDPSTEYQIQAGVLVFLGVPFESAEGGEDPAPTPAPVYVYENFTLTVDGESATLSVAGGGSDTLYVQGEAAMVMGSDGSVVAALYPEYTGSGLLSWQQVPGGYYFCGLFFEIVE